MRHNLESEVIQKVEGELGLASLEVFRLLFLEGWTVKQTAVRTGLSRCFVKNAEYRIANLIALFEEDLAMNLDGVG